mmetsp:Transcript_15308/g.26773  ORF Transcript_15308/g.26773 Transcript_15308/m.26773 type:complete len:203 (+) Transcript_15308:423-1031(+)
MLATVGVGNTSSPFQQFGAAIVLIKSALDQEETIIVQRVIQRTHKLLLGIYTNGLALVLRRIAIQSLNKLDVIPVVNNVVRTVVNFDFNGIAAVVEQNDDRIGSVSNNRRNLLRSHLERTITNHCNATLLVLETQAHSQQSTDRPTDRSVLHLELVLASNGQMQTLAVEPRISRFYDQRMVGRQILLDMVHHVPGLQWATRW